MPSCREQGRQQEVRHADACSPSLLLLCSLAQPERRISACLDAQVVLLCVGHEWLHNEAVDLAHNPVHVHHLDGGSRHSGGGGRMQSARQLPVPAGMQTAGPRATTRPLATPITHTSTNPASQPASQPALTLFMRAAINCWASAQSSFRPTRSCLPRFPKRQSGLTTSLVCVIQGLAAAGGAGGRAGDRAGGVNRTTAGARLAGGRGSGGCQGRGQAAKQAPCNPSSLRLLSGSLTCQPCPCPAPPAHLRPALQSWLPP